MSTFLNMSASEEVSQLSCVLFSLLIYIFRPIILLSLYRIRKNRILIMILEVKSLLQIQQKKMKRFLVHTFFLLISLFIFLELNIESEEYLSSSESLCLSDSEESVKEEESIIKRNKVEEEPKTVPFANSFGSKVSFPFIFFFSLFLGYFWLCRKKHCVI